MAPILAPSEERWATQQALLGAFFAGSGGRRSSVVLTGETMRRMGWPVRPILAGVHLATAGRPGHDSLAD
jgi:hypothetical protein